MVTRGGGAVVLELRHALGQLRQPRENLQIDPHLLIDAATLHLDHHGLAILQPRAVYLANRRAGQRRLLELREKRRHGLAQLRFHDGQDHLRWIGRHIVLKPFQLIAQRSLGLLQLFFD